MCGRHKWMAPKLYTKINSCTAILNVTNPMNSLKFTEFDMNILGRHHGALVVKF